MVAFRIHLEHIVSPRSPGDAPVHNVNKMFWSSLAAAAHTEVCENLWNIFGASGLTEVSG